MQQKIVATYPYEDEKGKLLYECVRREPGRDGRAKDFSYRRPDGKGGWIPNLEGVEKVPYRLPELADPAKKRQPVFVVEGEKDVETLRALGFLATTNPCGAGGWLPQFGRYLRGRRVVLLPDNDSDGRRHSIAVAGSLVHWHAAGLRIVHLAGLPEHGDVTDWLADFPVERPGGADEYKRKALIEAVRRIPEWIPTPPRLTRVA